MKDIGYLKVEGKGFQQKSFKPGCGSFVFRFTSRRIRYQAAATSWQEYASSEPIRALQG
jgi:hypothetical protein